MSSPVSTSSTPTSSPHSTRSYTRSSCLLHHWRFRRLLECLRHSLAGARLSCVYCSFLTEPYADFHQESSLVALLELKQHIFVRQARLFDSTHPQTRLSSTKFLVAALKMSVSSPTLTPISVNTVLLAPRLEPMSLCPLLESHPHQLTSLATTLNLCFSLVPCYRALVRPPSSTLLVLSFTSDLLQCVMSMPPQHHHSAPL